MNAYVVSFMYVWSTWHSPMAQCGLPSDTSTYSPSKHRFEGLPDSLWYWCAIHWLPEANDASLTPTRNAANLKTGAGIFGFTSLVPSATPLISCEGHYRSNNGATWTMEHGPRIKLQIGYVWKIWTRVKVGYSSSVGWKEKKSPCHVLLCRGLIGQENSSRV